MFASISSRFLLVPLVSLAACGPMLVDQDVRDNANMVELRKRAHIQFDRTSGDYDGRYRGAKTRGFQIGPYGKRNASQDFTFSVEGAEGRTWRGSCEGRAQEQDLNFSKDKGNGVTVDATVQLQASSSASCEIEGGGQTYAVALTIGQSGTVSGGGEDIKLIPVYRYQERKNVQSGNILGYQLAQADTTLAAVQVRSKRRVWVRNDLTAERQELAASVAMALIGLDHLWTSPSDS